MKPPVLNLAEFDYALPADRIAQRPVRPRDASRLLVLRRGSGRPGGGACVALAHAAFRDLPELLLPGDLLVLNDTRVLSARLRGRKSATGGRIEVLLLERAGRGRWHALGRGLGKARVGEKISFASSAWSINPEAKLEAEVLAHRPDGSVTLAFSGPAADDPAQLGEMPIPPYIRRGHADGLDTTDYQSCFANTPGAVAAPTASLHFTPETLAALEARGVDRAHLTLHVGWGTFAPLREASIASGRLHGEAYVLPAETARAVNAARREGRRVIAVGTTTTRVLETRADDQGLITAGRGTTELFIRPGFRFRAIDGLLTNFHLPRSSLLLLVSAFAGRDAVMAAYDEAVKSGYRVYSYGDAMLLL